MSSGFSYFTSLTRPPTPPVCQPALSQRSRQKKRYKEEKGGTKRGVRPWRKLSPQPPLMS